MQMLVTALVAIAAHPIDAADEPATVRVYPVADLVTGPPQNRLGLAQLQEAGLQVELAAIRSMPSQAVHRVKKQRFPSGSASWWRF